MIAPLHLSVGIKINMMKLQAMKTGHTGALHCAKSAIDAWRANNRRTLHRDNNIKPVKLESTQWQPPDAVSFDSDCDFPHPLFLS
ncbi:MAG: hypothetical protein ACOYNF_18280 [Rhodoferax sp.]